MFKKEPVQLPVLELSEFCAFTPRILTEWKVLGNFFFFQYLFWQKIYILTKW